MLFTRDFGKLIRGSTSPFQIYAACILGSLIAFVPGFDRGPGLIVLWGFLLLILNANLFLSGLVGLAGKLIYLAALPLAFHIGRFLVDGPTQGLFASLANAPVTAYFGFEYYAVSGGQVLGLAWGLACGCFLSKGLRAFRLGRVAKQSGQENGKERSGWRRALAWIFLGGETKASYQELLARKVGNPIRIVGVAIVAIAIAGIFVVGRYFTDTVVASLARSGLEEANGATVDLESAHLDFDAGKLELVNLAMADPNDLNTDLFRTNRIVADVSSADLLRKRFSIDKLVVDSASSGMARETPGTLKGPAPKESPSILELPDFNDLDSVLENAKVWKERLSQLKRWMEQLSSVKKPDVLKAGDAWEKELSSRIRSAGYANVNTASLIEDSPILWIRAFEALGVKTNYFDGKTIDIRATDLSTQPHLVNTLPTISIKTAGGQLDAKLSLGLAAGKSENPLAFSYKGLPTSSLANAIKTDGKALLEGGTIDLSIKGDLNAIDSNLVASARFHDVTLKLSGSPTSLNGMELPLAIRGPIDSPRVKLEADFLKKALTQAGKAKLLDKASEELGVDLDSGSKDSLKKAAEGVLGGFLKKKAQEAEPEAPAGKEGQ